jgi:hypothetical protein
MLRDEWMINVVEGSCKFGAKTGNFFKTSVGNDDIADLIYDSIIKFKRNHQIGAEGDMGCGNA